jgi:hypothetical protein
MSTLMMGTEEVSTMLVCISAMMWLVTVEQLNVNKNISGRF